jgi:hypothetical protein
MRDKTKPIVVQSRKRKAKKKQTKKKKIQKIMEKKNSKKMQKNNPKKHEAKLFLILRFSRNQFLSKKKKFSPFFSETAEPIGLKFFLRVLQLNRGACFFFCFEILFL